MEDGAEAFLMTRQMGSHRFGAERALCNTPQHSSTSVLPGGIAETASPLSKTARTLSADFWKYRTLLVWTNCASSFSNHSGIPGIIYPFLKGAKDRLTNGRYSAMRGQTPRCSFRLSRLAVFRLGLGLWAFCSITTNNCHTLCLWASCHINLTIGVDRIGKA